MGKNYSLNKLLGFLLSKTVGYIFSKSTKSFKATLLNTYLFYCKNTRNNFNNKFSVALIIAEDWRFNFHYGVDFYAIIGAIRHNLTNNYLRGASTIEQQIVRVLTNDFEISYKRKLKEILLATLVDSLLPKRDITGVYLSIAYFGYGMTGIEQTCNKLNICMKYPTDEAVCNIVSRIKHPLGKIHNEKKLQRLNKRAEYILKLFYDNNFRKKSLLVDLE